MAKFGQQFLQGLLQPSYQKGMFTVGQQLGAIPAQRRKLEQAQAMKQQLAGIDTNTPEGLTGLAKFYQSQGDMENALKYATASRELAQKAADKKSLADLQTLVAKTADTLKLTDQAAAARSMTDPDELAKMLKDLRAVQVNRLPMDQGTVKRRLATAGYSPAEINNIETNKITRSELEALETFSKADLEAWQDAGGNIKAYRVTANGKVVDPETNKVVEPSSLNLVRKAPNAQEIIDKTSNKQKELLAEAGVAEFVSMNEKAKNARRAIGVIDRQTARVEGGMPTGVAANIEVTIAQIGQLLGRPYNPELISAQNYMQEAAELVKSEIKAFGSGTSITDADREYTQNMVGGDPRVQAEALLKLLEIRRKGMVQTIEDYHEIRSGYERQEMGDSLSAFPKYEIPSMVDPLADAPLTPGSTVTVGGVNYVVDQ